MASFFVKARERAEAAAHQFQESRSSANPETSPSAINHSPTNMPALPRRVPPLPGSSPNLGAAGAGLSSVKSPLPPATSPHPAPDPSRSSTSSFGAAFSASPVQEHAQLGEEGNLAPPQPTVAETGIIPASGTGGPKSGTLRPRRSSSIARSKSISAGAVAYLGPPGTYSYQAAVKVFGKEGSNLIPTQSIVGAIDFVKRGSPGNLKFAVVPFENSTHGPVKDTLDALCHLENDQNTQRGAKGKAHIIGETSLSIQHALLCGPKTHQHLLQAQGSHDLNDEIRPETLAQITNIFSHEQALGQCRIFISKNMPHARKKNVDSTAGAAVAALEFENGTAPGFADVSQHHEKSGVTAAIAPEDCAAQVGVRVLRTQIQDLADNKTRFMVLASEPISAILRSQILPGSLSGFLQDKPRVPATSRSLIHVFDGLEADLQTQATSPSALEKVLTGIAQQPSIRIRKIDRRPAPFCRGDGSDVPLSVWKSAYLVEVEFDGHNLEARRRVEGFTGSLGIWKVDSQDSTASKLGQAPAAIPGNVLGVSPSSPLAPSTPKPYGHAGLGADLTASAISELATDRGTLQRQYTKE